MKNNKADNGLTGKWNKVKPKSGMYLFPGDEILQKDIKEVFFFSILLDKMDNYGYYLK